MGKRPKAMNTKATALAQTVSARRVIGLVGVLFLLVAILGVAAAEAERIRLVSSEEAGHKGYLGIKMQELDSDLRKGLDLKVKNGVLVSEVVEGSPAEEAGIEDGDVIVSFDGKKVASAKELSELVAETDVGKKVKVKVSRDNRSKTLNVVVGEWPEDHTWVFATPDGFKDIHVQMFRPKLGVRIHEMDEDLASYFGVDKDGGVLVLGVEEESTAESAGIKAGDVIIELEGSEIESTKDLYDAVGKIDEGEKFEVTVVRKKKKVELEATMKEGQGPWHTEHFLGRGYVPKAENFWVPEMRDDLRKELDELREELEELKKEFRKVIKESKST